LGGPIPKKIQKSVPQQVQEPVQQTPIPVQKAPIPVQQAPIPVQQMSISRSKTSVQQPSENVISNKKNQISQHVEDIPETVLADELNNRDMAYLVHAKTEEKIYINKEHFTIGRNPQYVDFVVNNQTVGRTHLNIIHKNNQYFVIDINSKNGTYINQRRINSNVEEPLKNGCQLQIGTEVYYFYLQ
jgi:pSer/pThr/pTyr-binding forkhead associated (FHA) protein